MSNRTYKSNKTNKSDDRTPLWLIAGVLVGAVIVYLAMSEGKRKSSPAISNIQTSIAESVRIGAIDESGVVLAISGEPAKNSASPGSSEAPERSGPVSEDMIPKEAIHMWATKEKFSPQEFSARPGEVVTLALTSKDEFTHLLAFENVSLRAIALGVSGGETRVIRFNAPDKEGEYVFYKNMPGFYDIRGKMIVAEK